jgi:hypothetical protein
MDIRQYEASEGQGLDQLNRLEAIRQRISKDIDQLEVNNLVK